MNLQRILLAFLLGSFSLLGFNQVGIGTTTPDNSAELEVSSESKGLLIPRVDLTAVVNPATGLMVINTVDGKHYVNFGSPAAPDWHCMNPFETNSANGQITPSAPYDSVVGAFYGTFDGQVRGKVEANGRNSFEGNGAIPVNGIIMWKGSEASVPEGWAICDGYFYNPLNNGDKGPSATAARTIQTPDLRGRFIVGLTNEDYNGYSQDPAYANGVNNAAANSYRIAGSPGGNASVQLKPENLPTHSHDVIDYGHSHSITGEIMQKDGSSTKEVVAIDTRRDTQHGNETYTNKIGNSKTGVTARQTGGIYTYDREIPNPPRYMTPPACTVWQYTCTVTGGGTVQTNNDFTNTAWYTDNNSLQLFVANEYGYKVCTDVNLGYCGIGWSKDQLYGRIITNCTQNTNYYSSNPTCQHPDWRSDVPVGESIRVNERWEVQSVEIRPPYYVMAFIMRIR